MADHIRVKYLPHLVCSSSLPMQPWALGGLWLHHLICNYEVYQSIFSPSITPVLLLMWQHTSLIPFHLNFGYILSLPLNQPVKIPILHSAQGEGTFFRRHEHALHYIIILTFLSSDPAEHDFVPFFISRLIFLARCFSIQNTEKFTVEINLVGLVLQPRCDVRGGFADESEFERRRKRNLGGSLTEAIGFFLRGCLKIEKRWLVSDAVDLWKARKVKIFWRCESLFNSPCEVGK